MKMLLKQLLSRIPTKVPTGMTQFESWTNSIVELTGPIADEDSLKFVIASAVQRLDPLDAYKPKNYFVKILQTSAAKQLAGAVFVQIKEKQQAKQKAEAEQVKSNEP